MRKTHNKDLRFVKQDWQGNPIDENNQYANLDGMSARGLKDVFKWKIRQKNKYDDQKKGQVTNVKVRKNSDFLGNSKDGITWLGHATFVICIDGIK